MMQYGVKLHQPSILEIALLGEEEFFYSLRLIFLNGLKKIQESVVDSIDDKQGKEVIRCYNESQLLKLTYELIPTQKSALNGFFKLSFPGFKVISKGDYLFLANEVEEKILIIDQEFLENLKETWYDVYCVKFLLKEQADFNTKSSKANSIADKIKNSRSKVSKETESASHNSSILGYYASKLSVGSPSMNILNINQLTLYQLLDQFAGLMSFLEHKASFSAALQGGKGEVVNWLKDDNINT